jgi:subtilisin family serine protease
MKTPTLLSAVLCALLGSPALAAPADAATPRVQPDVIRAVEDGSVPVIVTLRAPWTTARPEARREAVRQATAPARERAQRLQRDGAMARLRPFDLTPAYAAVVTAEGLESLLRDPDVLSVERDDVWPVTTGEGLDLIGADDLWQTGITGRGTAVAVIDTGVDALHPTLGGATIPNPKIVHGRDTADDDDDPTDCSGHGTAVASIAVGATHQWSPSKTFEGGVAPEARLLAYKAAADGACHGLVESAVIAAIEDAIAHREGPDWRLAAISISAGGPPSAGHCDDLNPAMAAVVDQANRLGIAVVASAGNGGDRTGISAPACLSGTLAVGSVWDTDPIPGAATFCLDGACDHVCSDDAAFEGAMTCYTNAGPALDVLAPSEYLKAAQAGGLTTPFGGTSGATPYVAGAIALLRDLYPGLSPAEIRARLVLKSRMVQAGSPDLVRPLIQVHRALDPNDLAVGETPIPITEPGQPTVVRSTARIHEAGRVGGVRVWVRISHDDPSSVTVDLRAPGGEGVTLRAAGADIGAGPDAEDGLIAGTYPVDLRPAESLGRLSGVERQGVWVLEATASRGAPPVIRAWGLRVEDEGETVTDGVPLVVPVAARNPGADASLWRTHLQLVNPSPRPLEVGLVSGPDEGLESRRTSFVVPAGHRVALTDTLLDLGIDRATATLTVDAPEEMVAAALIVADSTGVRQAIPVLRPALEETVSAERHLLFLDGADVGRSNVGVTDLGGRGGIATFRFVNAETGEVAGHPVGLAVPPGGVATVTDVHRAAGAAAGIELRGIVTASDAGLWPWASVVDETSSDAIFIAGRPLSGADHHTIPVVSRAIGRSGELWTTDLRVLTDRDVRLVAQFRPTDGAEPVQRFIDVDAGRVLVVDDLVRTLFNLDSGTGALELICTTPEATWTAETRIRSLRPGRRTGQTVPSDASATAGTLLVPWLGDGHHTRTNLVITELIGTPVSVVGTIVTPDGRTAGEPFVVELSAGATRLVDPFALSGSGSCADCGAVLAPVGDGGISALASVLDLTTADPVTIVGVDITSP